MPPAPSGANISYAPTCEPAGSGILPGLVYRHGSDQGFKSAGSAVWTVTVVLVYSVADRIAEEVEPDNHGGNSNSLLITREPHFLSTRTVRDFAPERRRTVRHWLDFRPALI